MKTKKENEKAKHKGRTFGGSEAKRWGKVGKRRIEGQKVIT